MLLITVSFAIFDAGCQEGDPYRIGVQSLPSGDLGILYTDCDDTLIKRVALTRSGERDRPLWEIRASSDEGVAVYEYATGASVDPDFVITMQLDTAIDRDSRYLIIVDSDDLTGETYPFSGSELRPNQVLAGDVDYFTPEEFRAGALCD